MTYDVAIVGLGPVGCTAAILLAEAGLSIVAFECDAAVYKLPRAVNLDGEIIRAFQGVARGTKVDELMQSVRPGDRAGFANSKREWMFGQTFANFGANGWQPGNMFDQPELEQYLRNEATVHTNVTSYIGYEVVTIDHENSHPSVSIEALNTTTAMPASAESTGEVVKVDARYLISCDGASSFTRKMFNIGWHDLGYNHEWLVVDVTVGKNHTLSNDTVQVCDPDRIVTYVCTKDPYRRWEFKLNEGETRAEMLAPEKIHSLIDPWTPRNTYEIRRAAVYEFHAATADWWHHDNIFIAGDAAHQTPPFLGQGMNTGMRDAINLAWKIPMVINGLAGDQLLDTYFTEREAHAHDLVDWAVSIGRLMDHLANVERTVRNGDPEPEAPAALQSASYGQGREQPPIREGVLMLDQVSDTGSTCYLFAQPNVINADGTHLKLDRLLGRGFAVVTRSNKALQLSESSSAILNRLGAKLISLDGLSLDRGHFDRLFEQHETAIIRPDKIVFGHTTDDISLDQLVSLLAEKLALTNLWRLDNYEPISQWRDA